MFSIWGAQQRDLENSSCDERRMSDSVAYSLLSKKAADLCASFASVLLLGGFQFEALAHIPSLVHLMTGQTVISWNDVKEAGKLQKVEVNLSFPCIWGAGLVLLGALLVSSALRCN